MRTKQFFRLVNTFVVFSIIIYVSTMVIGRFKTIRETVSKKEDAKMEEMIATMSGLKTDIATLRELVYEIKKQGL